MVRYFIEPLGQPLPPIEAADISEQRRTQLLAMKSERHRQESLAAYLLLKRALSEAFGITGNPEFEYNEHGKPLLKQHPGIHFNISHCAKAVAVAVSDRPVGIDIELVNRYNDRLAAYVLTAEELEEVKQSGNPPLTFTSYWTRKEAVLKMTGTGLNGGVRDSLALHPQAEFIEAIAPDGTYVCSVCCFE